MDSLGPVYCFSMDDGIGYYKICQAWPKTDLFDRIDEIMIANPNLKDAGKVLKSKLSSHKAREKLGSGKSVGVLKLRSEALNEDAERIKWIAEETGILGVEVLGKTSCFTSWYELQVFGKGVGVDR